MPTTEIEINDLSKLGRDLYTETVTIDPNADTNAPSRPIDEADFDENGNELRKIQYKALLTAPGPNATDFDGNPRKFVIEREGVYTKGDKEGQKYVYWTIDFDVKIVAFADGQRDQTVLQGRAGKFQEFKINSFTKKKNGQPYTEISDLANKLGLFSNLPPLAEGEKTVTLNTAELTQLVAQAIKEGNREIGVTVKWVAGWEDGAKDETTGLQERGSYAFAGERNFPVGKDGLRNPIVSVNNQDKMARVKIAQFFKL